MTDKAIPELIRGKFWLVSADMGYGHQRAIYPLKKLAYNGHILNANTSEAATHAERRMWRRMQGTYEFISRAGKVPFIGKYFNRLLDKLLFIPKNYPFKDHSLPTLQVKLLNMSIKRGLCNGVVKDISLPPLPMITSFYSSAIAAEMAGHQRVYCIICDTDINRVWAAEKASASNIVYFAPNGTAAKRLVSYGVSKTNIHVTGFPLPLDLLGNRDLDTLRKNLYHRLKRLDPKGRFFNIFNSSTREFTGYDDDEKYQQEPITITFAVGGAGAQKEIGKQIAKSLKKKIREGKVILNLVAGTRSDARDYFASIKATILNDSTNVSVIYAETNEAYFDVFNQILHDTDVLWTKPSELSFYCALGIPIIITPAIGPQEKCNRRWLREIGAGFKQKNPKYTHQWLFEMLRKGRLAEASWNGFLKARKYGTYKIMDYLHTGSYEISIDPRKR